MPSASSIPASTVAAGSTVSIAELPVGGAGRIDRIGGGAGHGIDDREADWLRAVGLFEGAHVRLLRRAILGGPLHLRTSWGAELAIDRELARAVLVVPTDGLGGEEPAAPEGAGR